MKLSFFKITFLILFSTSTFGQTLWSKISEKEINANEVRDRATPPSSYQLFSLDLNLMKQLLQNAPLNSVDSNNVIILSFPNSEGIISNFKICEATIMEEGLQAKYPTLKSYIAVGVDNPRTSLRFSITDFGLHAMSITNEKGTYFIDSYTKDSSKYILYYKKHCFTTKQFGCQTQSNNASKKTQNENKAQSFLSNDVVFRQYRFAMTTSADYSQFHIDAAEVTNGTLAQKKSAVLSAIVVSMTRINGVFERDLGVRLNLVANNDLLISIGTDNFTLDNILDENIAFTNLNIGFENYDVGHIVTLGSGGIAAYACICTEGKAAGTTGTNSPVGDPFDIDYVAHEIGHQFGGNHTFNNSCGDNVATEHSVEPGSGSTIMSYAGICSPNVQNHADAYFSVTTIQEIGLTLNNPDNNCASITSSTSATPTIAPLTNYVIPRRTAFILKGNATATNLDLLTYCWEQTNTEISIQPPVANSTTGPNYRSLMPSFSPDRYMPSFSNVMAGNLVPTWEVTPSVARIMNFALTIRDNTPNGGQTETANMTVQVKNNSGIFRITSMNTDNISYTPGTNHNLTWNVAGTTANGINTATVTISISTDNGVTFSPLLVSTPNDGSAQIQFPFTHSPYCRIMISADLNIYYALSRNFCLGYEITTECTNYSDNDEIPIISDENGGFITRTINVPQNGNVSDVNLYTNITHEYFGDFKMDISSPTNPDNYVMIYDGNCGDLNGTLNLKFTEGGSTINCNTSNTLQNVAPTESFNIFNFQNQQGEWTIRVYDHAAPDEGTINSWSLEICREIPVLICAPIVSATGTNKIWNGTNWLPSTPTEIDTATIFASGSPGSFVCNTLEIGTNNITILDGETIEVVNDISGTGTITMSTTASILQRNDDSIIEPTLSLTKKTRSGMHVFDYIYWGSPMSTTSLSVLDAAIATGGVPGAFDLKYKYVSGDLTSSGGWQNLTEIEKGKGFITRIKQIYPFTTINTPVNEQVSLTFTGNANNGEINVPISVTNPNTSARNNNLLSNPYPSAIDADKFLAYNTNIDGVVYLWKAQTPNIANGSNYSVADYIAYTRAGSTAASGIDPNSFNGKIATGQGFKVRALENGNVIFNNCMRVSGNNGSFMRNSSISNSAPTQVNRYKLNLTDSNGKGNQILVAYLPEATLEYDRMYDAELLSNSDTKIYSFLANSTKKIAINARPTFEITDSLNLGLSKSNLESENATISVSEKEGVFANNQTSIYLFDSLLNQTYNLSTAPYIVYLNEQEINNRFKIVYQYNTLNSNEFSLNSIQAYITNTTIDINSSIPMTSISIYDLFGRLIKEINTNDNITYTDEFYFEEGIYIVKIQLANGEISTHKIINEK